MTTSRPGSYAPAALMGYQEDFSRLVESRSSSEPEWLLRLRRRCMAAFEELGFPTPRRGNEDWKYTTVEPIAQTSFHDQVGESVDPRFLKGLNLAGCDSLVFVNGRFDATLSSIPKNRAGIVLEPLSNALGSHQAELRDSLGTLVAPSGDGFTALSTALFLDGAYIEIAARKQLKEPIHLLFLHAAAGRGNGDTRTSIFPRTFIRMGELAQATIIETHASISGDQPYLSVPLSEVSLAEGASLQHYKLIDEASQGFHVATAQVRQDRGSHFRSLSTCFGGQLVRNTMRVLLDGTDAECRLDGLYIASGEQHIDNHTFVDHASPRTTSDELFKGLLGGKSHGVFTGRVLVRRDSQNIAAHQHNRNLLLSPKAQVDSRPQLEIFADDVKCTHGATAGQLSEADMFFLRSRGLDEQLARELLAHAFAQEILDRIEVAPLKRRVERLLSKGMPTNQPNAS